MVRYYHGFIFAAMSVFAEKQRGICALLSKTQHKKNRTNVFLRRLCFFAFIRFYSG